MIDQILSYLTKEEMRTEYLISRLKTPLNDYLQYLESDESLKKMFDDDIYILKKLLS